MQLGLSSLGVGGMSHVDQHPVSAASAAVGVFSTANYWSRTAQTDLAPGNTVILIFRKRTNSGNQTFWGCCRAAGGWFINSSGGALGRLDIFFRGGANPFYPLNNGAALPDGYHCVAITCTAGGQLRSSMNGLAVSLATASPAYVANDGTSLETIGRVNNAVNTFACAQGDVVTVAYLTRAFSDAELAAASAQINSLNGFQMSEAVRNDSALQYEHLFARDWDGAAATSTSGRGSAPATFAKQGTGGTKNAIPAFITHHFAYREDLLNCMFFSRGEMTFDAPGLLQANHFASTRFTTASDWIRIRVAAMNSGAAHDTDHIGIQVNGTFDTVSTQIIGFFVDQTISRSGLTGTNVIEATGNYHEFEGAHYDYGNGLSISGVSVPISAPLVFDRARPQARLQITYNSMSGKVVDGNGTVTSSAIQSMIARIRALVRASTNPAWANGDVTGDGWGGRNWANFIKCPDYAAALGFTQATRRDYMIALQLSGLNGTVKNVQYWCLGPNDYILNSYADLSLFQTDLGAYLDRFKQLAEAASIPGISYYLQTAVPKTDESAVGGHTCQDYRNAEIAVCSTRPWIILVDGTVMTTVADLGDALHFHVVGNTHYAAAHQAVVGY